MTTKQRAYLKSLAMTMDPIFQIGKSSMTPSLTQAISEALDARELIKISVLRMIRELWQKWWLNAPVLRSYRSSAKKLYCTKKEKTIRKKSYFRRRFL